MPIQKFKNFLFNFFHFNKQERNGVFVLCLVIVILVAIRLMMLYFGSNVTNVELITVNIPSTGNLNVENTGSSFQADEINTNLVNKKNASQRFVFNPNTVTEEDAQKLGFSKKLSATLINFRNKGGKFFKAEDLKKLYGLSPNLYEELESYILIPNNKKEYKRDSSFVYKPHTYDKKVYTKEIIELNTADSLAIVYLKGIGPGFTKRIIKYRTMLGGFHSINQLKEVYGMTDSLFITLSSQVKIDANSLTKIPINAIDFNSLRKHPYFNFQSAQAIVNFRLKHGKLTETDVKNLGIFSEEKLWLILPYLSY